MGEIIKTWYNKGNGKEKIETYERAGGDARVARGILAAGDGGTDARAGGGAGGDVVW